MSKSSSGTQSQWSVPTYLTDQFIDRVNGLTSTIPVDYLKSVFLSKYVSPDTDPAETRRSRALSKWLATDMENRATEDRLLFTPDGYHILPRVSYIQFTDWCRAFIADLIGDTPPDEALLGAFSGGASTSRSRAVSYPAHKYVGQAHITARAVPAYFRLAELTPGWHSGTNRLHLEFVRGNVFFTVPKKTDIDRAACKEPDVNMYLQKGIGSFFRRCLRTNGINLNDQSVNRRLARLGSIDGSLATLDLASASDSVTRELVFQFLPITWFTLLDSVRSHVTIIDGEEHVNTMFSSMGNGFTFELESLLFYTLARATAYFTGTRGICSVYGDDIICPSGMSHDLVWVLQWFGFTSNENKSYHEGPFRESCGGHYHSGTDITPFYLRKPIMELPDLIHLANSVRLFGGTDSVVCSDGTLVSVNPEVHNLWLWLSSHIPQDLRGGSDCSFKYQLVSTDIPVNRLHEETSSRRLADGAYYHWLNSTWHRTVDSSLQTSMLSRAKGRLRRLPVRSKVKPQPSVLFEEECR